MKNFELPEPCLVLLVGPSGSGKSTFAAKHFLPTEVVSSDDCRGMVADDTESLDATADAFDVLNLIVEKRLQRRRLTVVDATNVRQEDRSKLISLARSQHTLVVAIVFDLHEKTLIAQNEQRTDRVLPKRVLLRQRSQLRQGLRKLSREGYVRTLTLRTPEEIDAVTFRRVPLWVDKRDVTGPLDIIGDVHGCATELETLLKKLGYESVPFEESEDTTDEVCAFWGGHTYRHPDGRLAMFVGDLVDRGPRSLDAVKIARNMVVSGNGLCVPGNHDDKFARWLKGTKVQVKHGLETTVAEFEACPSAEKQLCRVEMRRFLESLVSHFVFDDGRLVVAHAGLKEHYQGRASRRVRDFALYGETTGEVDELGLPVRGDWAADYRGEAMVIYGHTPVAGYRWINRTLNIDTGCVFGGALTALRYPERELVRVEAEQQYAIPRRPLKPDPEVDAFLDLSDVQGKLLIQTRLRNRITIPEGQSAAALETMSRFAVDPRWLIYLPPTMAPAQSSTREGFLEHPAEAFDEFAKWGVSQVVCEEKHMGSRAVVVICRDAETARKRFGVADRSGSVYTRTGRPFFEDEQTEEELLSRLREALDRIQFWDRHETGWACFDCELMPWSAKAQALLRQQYAAVAASGEAAVPEVISALDRTLQRHPDGHDSLTELRDRISGLATGVSRFRDAYHAYCWPVQSLDEYRLAPFHLMATEGHVHAECDHLWHLGEIGRICGTEDPLLMQTEWRELDLSDESARDAAIEWWLKKTEAGGEGMVIKPIDFTTHIDNRLVQPAMKCRGREYLRIIYGPDYLSDQHLPRLRKRNLGKKRNLALQEFALGLEALERFVTYDSLSRVHQCAFGLLALESEAVDPRL